MSTNNSDTILPFVFVDFASSPIEALAGDIIALDKPNAADLSAITVWCESRSEIHSIKLSLMQAGKAAGIHQLMLPTIITLQDWLWQHAPPEQALISETNKQLLLVEAIRQSPTLFQTNNAWPLAKELVNLFNECSLAQIPLHDGEQALREVLQNSYQYSSSNTENISRESEIVYRLWQAYREQIQARGWLDPIEYYSQQLTSIDQNKILPPTQQCFLVGMHRLSSTEIVFLKTLTSTHRLFIYSPRVSLEQHGTHHHPHACFSKNNYTNTVSEDKRESALDIIFDRTHHMYDRIQHFKNKFPENIFCDWLSIYTCHSTEHHISAVSLQTKKWLIEGVTSIGIIVNDRLLARRIRAVLEEQGIQPTDLGGWTLSTTSAATSIEVLLDAIEHNFRKDPLLDLLSSPFLPNNNYPDSSYAHQTYELRKYLKKHRNSNSDSLDSISQLAQRHFAAETVDCSELNDVIASIKLSCETLQEYTKYGEYELCVFSDALINALKKLGLYEALDNDIAGKQLIETLDNHIQTVRNNNTKINWKEWRQWLRDLFEHNYFIPSNTDERVTLCGFEHTDNVNFKAVIIAGVEEKRLTKTKSQRTFFNEKVCHELHLPTNLEANAINFVRFRQLIQQSDTTLLTAEIETHGEPQELGSWVKLINIFSEETHASIINNHELDNLIHAYKEHKRSIHHLHIDKTTQPDVSAPAELIPSRVSATQYQALMDCPYQYFAKYILDLRDQDTADEFEASDYGMLVHQCLYKFHFEAINKTEHSFSIDNRDILIKQLSDTSTTTFMRAAFPNTIKQGWLQRWLNNVPAYIDWAIQRAKEWRTLRGESLIQTHLNERFSLYGQIDRIDSDTQHLAVIDYKTGSTKPTKKHVLNGELVQLPFYALLDDNITQAEYLSLGSQGEVKASALIKNEELSALKEEHKPRLENLLSCLLDQAELIAQGDDNACRVCDYQGLCRKEHWNHQQPQANVK